MTLKLTSQDLGVAGTSQKQRDVYLLDNATSYQGSLRAVRQEFRRTRDRFRKGMSCTPLPWAWAREIFAKSRVKAHLLLGE